MRKVPLLGLLLGVSMVASLLVVALPAPALAAVHPIACYGTITLDGAPAPVGTTIEIFVGSDTTPSGSDTVTTAGEYLMDMWADDSSHGEALTYKVDGFIANKLGPDAGVFGWVNQHVNIAAVSGPQPTPTPTPPPTPSASTVWIVLPTQIVNTGPFTVNVFVYPAEPIAGVQFNLSFDPSLIEAVSVTEGPLLGLSGCSTFFLPGTINNSIGTVTGVAGTALGTGCSVSTPSTFATINFIADHLDGISPLDLFDVKVVDVDGNQVPIVVYNGEVEVDLTPWDVNDDGCVDISDLVLVAQHWSETGPPGWIPEDVNDDGVIDISDLVIVAQHWGEGC